MQTTGAAFRLGHLRQGERQRGRLGTRLILPPSLPLPPPPHQQLYDTLLWLCGATSSCSAHNLFLLLPHHVFAELHRTDVPHVLRSQAPPFAVNAFCST